MKQLGADDRIGPDGQAAQTQDQRQGKIPEVPLPPFDFCGF